jgi:hypothetical protein
MIDDNQIHILKNDLRNGVNLLVGAGFSIFANGGPKGRDLPVGNALRDELVSALKITGGQSTLPLPKLYSILMAGPKKQDAINYLTKRFKVNVFDKAYENIKNIKINNLMTTNIDDLFYKIFDGCREYIHDMIQYGPDRENDGAINYLPLHGSVNYPERGYVFTSTDLAAAYKSNISGHETLKFLLASAPTVIIGYSMEDPGVLSMFENEGLSSAGQAARWYFTRSDDEGEHEYYRSLGLTPIIGGTKEFLNILGELKPNPEGLSKKQRKTDGLPQLSEISAQGLESYFRGDAPKWYDMYFDRVPALSRFSEILNRSLGGKNSLLLGVNYSGKTTMLMQIAAYLKKHTSDDITFVDYLTPERATHLVKSGASGHLLVDNCCSSVQGFNIAAKSGQFVIVATDREFNYDVSMQHLHLRGFKISNISGLSDQDTAVIYGAIPASIKKPSMKIPHLNNDAKPFALEFVQENVNYAEGSNWQKRLLSDIRKIDVNLSRMLIMSCFVHCCRGGISDELLCSFMGDYTSGRPFELMNRLRAYLTETPGYPAAQGLLPVTANMDFYVPRSNLFSDQVVRVASDNDFKSMYNQFFRNVRSDVIPRWNNFRISAYQVYYTKRAYPEWKDGKNFYDELFNRDQNYYDLQHASLYLSSKGQHALAFLYIDKALQLSRNKVFSIRNTHAQVLFAANINNAPADERAEREVMDSMKILKGCLEDDRRSRNHAIVYAEQTIQIAEVIGRRVALPFIPLATKAIAAEMEKGTTWKIRKLARDLARLN